MIPAELEWLFWDVDPTTIDLALHREYIIERVMARGDWFAMRWLIANFAKAELAACLRERGDRLAPRERAFWCLIAELPWEPTPGGGRPGWAG